jgi:undecaprenyl diphosphate synthase
VRGGSFDYTANVYGIISLMTATPNTVTLPKGTVIPNHIAIIMDGNGRWARSKGLPATKGHEKGAEAMLNLVKAARSWGVHTVTLWAFSTENWKRPPKEVAKILSLTKLYISRELANAHKEEVRFIHIGRKDHLPNDILKAIKKAEDETAHYKKHVLNLALDYGGHEEILHVVKQIVKDGISEDAIDEKLFERYLYTANQPYPNPDLLIRTSGEQRTSGLMPWQLTYAEFYFEESHLPDMNPEKLRTAILDFSRRRRRFGAKDKVHHFKFEPEMTAKLELGWWRLKKIPKGTAFGEYAVQHLSEQFGLSAKLAKEAAVLMAQAVKEGEANKWEKAKKPLKKFYEILKEELKLAFEPKLAASLEVKLWRDTKNKESIQEAVGVEDTARELYAEVYRISLFQAAKLAHLRVLATVEQNLAERGYGEKHWDNAEDYLEKFYKELKQRVA